MQSTSKKFSSLVHDPKTFFASFCRDSTIFPFPADGSRTVLIILKLRPSTIFQSIYPVSGKNLCFLTYFFLLERTRPLRAHPLKSAPIGDALPYRRQYGYFLSFKIWIASDTCFCCNPPSDILFTKILSEPEYFQGHIFDILIC